MRQALYGFEGNVFIGGKAFDNLRYADDIVLIGNSIKEAQQLVVRVREVNEAVGRKLMRRRPR